MPPLLENLLIFGAGVVMLIIGGDVLVRGAVHLAKRFGVSALLIGLTVVAFGTSAPELALNVIAALNGHSELSFGNIIGSNIANIGLILGFVALLSPLTVHASVIRRELPIMLFVTILAAALLLLPGFISSSEPAETAARGLDMLDGSVLLLGFVAFLLVAWTIAKKDRAFAAQFEEEASEAAGDTNQPAGLLKAITLFVVGLAVLTGGGWVSEHGAVEAAKTLGMSQEVIGLTIVAIATSLPELAASIMAVRKGHTDIAVGNVVGSNVFNILLVLGATGVITPISLPENGLFSLGAMLLLSMLMLPMCALGHNKGTDKDNGKTGSPTAGSKIVSRAEGSILLLLYISYMVYLVVDATQNSGAAGE